MSVSSLSGVETTAILSGLDAMAASDLKFQPTCYYATPGHSTSLWGKFLWLYKGNGSLRLTSESLSLASKSFQLDLPLAKIVGISMGLFSRWAKPFGLMYLILEYQAGQEVKVIHLIPAVSTLTPSWETSQLVADWFDTIVQIGNLDSCVKRPLPKLPERPTILQMAIFLMALYLPLLGLLFLSLFFLTAR